MGNRKKRTPGPQHHAEGQHGEKTHRRFMEMLTESSSSGDESEIIRAHTEGQHRLHEDRQQHDEAEKGSEKVEAMKEIRRGDADEDVLSHARIPHEGDSA
ncbi:MAG: hypothetical protein ACRENU_10900 [Gemmatimonadaceae bacterium]